MKFKILLLAVAAFFFALSCSNDKDFKEEKSVVSLNFDTSCLKDISLFAELYLEEKASRERIEKNFNCMIEAIDYVQLRVAGKREGEFQLSEVESFLNSFLFSSEERKETSFFKSVLKLKQGLYGGSQNILTFLELKKLQNLLYDLKFLALENRKHVQEFLFKEEYPSDQQKDLVLSRFQKFLFKQFSSFNFLDLDSAFSLMSLEKPEKWKILIKIFLGGESEEKFISQGKLLKAPARIAKFYDIAHSLKKNYSEDWTKNRSSFNSLKGPVQRLLKEFRLLILEQERQAVSEDDLVGLLDFLNDSEENYDLNFRAYLGDYLLNQLFLSKGNGLNLAAFDRFNSIFNSFLFFLQESKAAEGYKGYEFPTLPEAKGNFASFLKLKWPSLVDESLSLYLPDHAPEVTFSFESFFHMAWQYAAAELITGSYSEEGALDLEQVKKAFLDIFPLLKKMELMGEKARGSWFRIYNEGNLFVPSAHPDGVVSRDEVAEYFAFMFSGYNAGTDLNDFLKKECPNLGKGCVFEKMRSHPEEAFKSLPSLADFFSGAETEENDIKIWEDSFEFIAKLENNNQNFTANHLFRSLIGSQYIEVIFRKYDLDHNDNLNYKEAEAAFESFKHALMLLPQVKGTAAEKDERILKTFFTYFVDKGKLPELKNGRPTGKFYRYFLKCRFNPRACDFKSPRSNILSILAFLTGVKFDK